jgi:hypothetical protein
VPGQPPRPFDQEFYPALRGPVFEPLRDPHGFRNFVIHLDFHTLAWANGADFAPEFLHDNVRVAAS